MVLLPYFCHNFHILCIIHKDLDYFIFLHKASAFELEVISNGQVLQDHMT